MNNTKINDNFAKCYLKNILLYDCTFIYTKEVATKIIAISLVIFKRRIYIV